jgi:hypothetical protein
MKDPLSPGNCTDNSNIMSPSPAGRKKISVASLGANKFNVDTKDQARSRFVRSTLVGKMSIAASEKVELAMTNETRELMKLQRIYQIEQENAEARRRLREDSI